MRLGEEFKGIVIICDELENAPLSQEAAERTIER
jgi:hypothetical protein